jgi:hypothetical protein
VLMLMKKLKNPQQPTTTIPKIKISHNQHISFLNLPTNSISHNNKMNLLIKEFVVIGVSIKKCT